MVKGVDFELVDDVLHLRYKDIGKIDLEKAIEIVNYRMVITQGAIYPLLISNNSLTTVSKKAYQHFATVGMVDISANALVVEDKISKLLASIFTFFVPSDIPLKIFSNKEDALVWLEKYKVLEKK